MSTKTVDRLRPRIILVLGMHRSGTSVATRVVNLLGAGLGGELVPPGPDNPKGFWELAAAVEINDGLLKDIGRTWYDMREMPAGWLESTAAKDSLAKIAKIIRADFSGQPLCVLKDPRLCLVAPLWVKAFQSAGFEVNCVFVIRDPVAVVDSLHVRNQWPRAPLFLMWAQYLMEAEAGTDGYPRTMIAYEELVQDWRGTMVRVAEDLGFQWPVEPESVAREVDGYIVRRRHGQGGGVSKFPSEAPAFASDLYDACLGVVGRSGDWTGISQLRKSFRNAAELYAAHVDNLVAERWAADAKAQTAQVELAASGAAFERAWSERTDGLAAGIFSLSDKMDHLLIHAEGVGKQVEKTMADDSRFQALELGLEELARRVAATDEHSAARAQAVDARVEEFLIESARTGATLAERAQSFEQGAAALERTIGEAETRLAARVRPVEERFEELALELARPNETLSRSVVEIREQMDRFARDIREQFDRVEQGTMGQSSALSALELRVQRRIDREERLLQTLHRRVDPIETTLVNKIDTGYAELLRRTDALEKQLRIVRGDVSAQDADRDATVTQLTNTINALTSSTSWKVTAPLRWFKRLLWRRTRLMR